MSLERGNRGEALNCDPCAGLLRNSLVVGVEPSPAMPSFSDLLPLSIEDSGEPSEPGRSQGSNGPEAFFSTEEGISPSIR